MSYTELYKFNKKGDAEFLGEVHNAWRGAMAVWDILDERYLPPYIPEWAKRLGETDKRYHRGGDPGGEALKEVWALNKSPEISDVDRIVLYSTYDNCVVKKENLPALIKAFEDFRGETNLKEQADLLKTILNDEDCIAVGWNQTSVIGDTWTNFGGRNDEDEEIPYNIKEMSGRHWFMFEEILKDTEACSSLPAQYPSEG